MIRGRTSGLDDAITHQQGGREVSSIAYLVLPPITAIKLGLLAILSKGTGLGGILMFVIVLANHKRLLQVVILRKETFHSCVISFRLVFGRAVSAASGLLLRVGIPCKEVN